MYWKSGDRGFILISNRQVRPVEVLRTSGGFCSVRFLDDSLYPGAIRLRPSRLFKTALDAEGAIRQRPESSGSLPPYARLS